MAPQLALCIAMVAPDAPPTLYGLGTIPKELYGVSISLLVITWSAALSRAYVRGYVLRSVGWDDWTLIPAQLCYTVQCAYMIRMAQMEMNADKNSDIRSISQLVTNLVAFWHLRFDLYSSQNIARPLLPTNHYRRMATQRYPCWHTNQHALRHHILWPLHFRLRRSCEIPFAYHSQAMHFY